MSLPLSPPPMQLPSDFARDKEKNAFFNALLNTIYQIWTAIFGIRQAVIVRTTDATLTALFRVDVEDGKTVMINAVVVARRTGGTAGANGDSAFYFMLGAYKNVGGVLTGIGTPTVLGGEDQAAWACDFTSVAGTAIVAVTGATSNDITWEGAFYTYEVGA